MTRVAAVDCGTNSIRLLVADVSPRGTLVDVVRRMEVVRLGEGVDRTGRLAPAALERTLTALRSYADDIAAAGAARVRMCATSAARDAANHDELTARVVAVLGVEPEVVSGDEEARLSFAGATRELAAGPGLGPEPYLVVDIGGGSTELVLGATSVLAACSLDVGCVRLTERHWFDDPPSPTQVRTARADVEAALADAARTMPLSSSGTLVGLAGSVTTVAALALDLPAYEPSRIHHARIPASAVAEVCDRLLAMSTAQRVRLPVMHPGRADVIGAGALILRVVVETLGAVEVIASEHDILDGIAWSLVERGQP